MKTIAFITAPYSSTEEERDLVAKKVAHFLANIGGAVVAMEGWKMELHRFDDIEVTGESAAEEVDASYAIPAPGDRGARTKEPQLTEERVRELIDEAFTKKAERVARGMRHAFGTEPFLVDCGRMTIGEAAEATGQSVEAILDSLDPAKASLLPSVVSAMKSSGSLRDGKPCQGQSARISDAPGIGPSVPPPPPPPPNG